VENPLKSVENSVEKPVENSRYLWNKKSTIHSLWKTWLFFPQVFHRWVRVQNLT
jgi:hypothetical protein